MAFIDEITIHAKAGRGGNGVVRWRHEKGKEFAGAAGGNGGSGGDVYVEALRDIGILARYKTIKEFNAGNGHDGLRNSKSGKDGIDFVIELPVGSVVTNLNTKKKFQLLIEGDKKLILEGGRGGLGNEHFKASTNTTPRESTPGKDGEGGDFYIELELLADAGLIGLPNAGKSSLLNELTNATAKVGSYQFTTLEPNLGAMREYILADIPGLIEGASEGRGLGHKFLRHIRRTKTLFHCISCENEKVGEVYDTIKEELRKYDTELAEKPEVIILTKTDLVEREELKNKIREAKTKNKEVLTVNVYDDEAIKKLSENMIHFLNK